MKKKKNINRFILYIFIFINIFMLSLKVSQTKADEFIKGIYPATPPSAFTLYAFDPDLLGGWDTPLRDYELKYILEKYTNLPILGGWYGQGFVPDPETLIASGLKKAFLLTNDYLSSSKIKTELSKIGIELFAFPDGLDELPACFLEMGKTFNRQKRGEELADYAKNSLESVKKTVRFLPNEKRPKVYLAMDADGLSTSCRGGMRSYFIEAAGGFNVYECPSTIINSRPHISFEDLVNFNPDVILVENPILFKTISNDPKWTSLRAIKEGRVFLIPRGPFSWLGHPTLTSLIGLKWLANILHPDLYPLDLKEETKYFTKLFFHVNLSDSEINDILNGAL